jgi:two-component system chemotaxis response regulator CheY
MAQIRRHIANKNMGRHLERGDFSGHKIMLLGGKTHAMALLRSILTIMGITRIVHVQDTRSAMELLGMETFHAVFYDPKAASFEAMPFPVAARRQENMVNPLVPIFALHPRPHRGDVEQARDAGVTDVITVPVSPRTVMTKLKAAPRPFIVAQEYFGPDRRAKSRAPWYGSDRRTRAPRKQKIDFVAI